MVSEQQESRSGDQGGDIRGLQHQQLIADAAAGAGQLLVQINLTPGKTPHFDRKVTCR
jgi:hypothetical protein